MAKKARKSVMELSLMRPELEYSQKNFSQLF